MFAGEMSVKYFTALFNGNPQAACMWEWLRLRLAVKQYSPTVYVNNHPETLPLFS
jgi:hypothetical protein